MSAIYLVKVFNPEVGNTKAHPTAEEVLGPLVDQVLADPDLSVRLFICDMPARHFIRGHISYSGQYSCLTCIAKAKTKPINWPFQSSWGRPERTVQMMIEAVQ